MLERLQEAVDAVEESRYDAILLGYLLCGNGIAGLRALSAPLVIPRGHDCITLFLGGKERYLEYFHSHPGVYFKTTGWIERGEGLVQLCDSSGLGRTLDEYVARYGEDNGRYLWEQLGDYTRNYRQLTFIEMGVEADGRFEDATREEAARRGWQFEKAAGDMGLFERLVNGNWSRLEFLEVPPGWRVVASEDEEIIRAEQA